VALRIYRTLKGELQAGPVAEEYKKACAKVRRVAGLSSVQVELAAKMPSICGRKTKG
jgi:hypothetical protein